MKRIILLLLMTGGMVSCTQSNDTLPVRGFCIAAPSADGLAQFIKFINEELVPRNVNVLVLRVDYNYQFKSHPELASANGLSETDVKQLVRVCRDNNIRLIPQINLLGHQSWQESMGTLLTVYPEFDETPGIKLPENYNWPNADSLYCKSYCPLHPDVHRIVFDVVDEICDVFEADAFHAGMDEVFYIGDSNCPRCKGHSKAELFAGEVNAIRNHLALKNRQLWIWGDRLIDGRATDTGEWEGSYNHTWPAVDMISKDVMICDWHYEYAYKTPRYFVKKGLHVISCLWRKPDCAVKETRNQLRFRRHASKDDKEKYCGMMQTVWSGSGSFISSFYDAKSTEKNTEANCFRELFKEINKTTK
jgi:hypothetical protein